MVLRGAHVDLLDQTRGICRLVLGPLARHISDISGGVHIDAVQCET